jgi:hypothetical protein
MMMTNHRSIEALLCHGDFGNPSIEKHGQSAELVMCFLIVVSAFYLWFDNESFTQVFLLVVGVFRANQLNCFTEATPISDHIVMAVFIAVFRVFLLLRLERFRTHSHTSPKAFAVVFLSDIERQSVQFVGLVEVAGTGMGTSSTTKLDL